MSTPTPQDGLGALTPSEHAAHRAKEAATQGPRESTKLRANLRHVEAEQAYHLTVAEQHLDLARAMQPTINILKTQIERAESDENNARPR